MKVSELIRELEQRLAEDGDLRVQIFLNSAAPLAPLTEVVVVHGELWLESEY